MMLDTGRWVGEHCFLPSETYEIHVNASITVKVLDSICFRVMVENWRPLKGTLGFLFFSCVLELK